MANVEDTLSSDTKDSDFLCSTKISFRSQEFSTEPKVVRPSLSVVFEWTIHSHRAVTQVRLIIIIGNKIRRSIVFTDFSLPESIEILHKLKLPPELSSSFDNSMVLNSRSPTSSSSSSSTTASTMVYLSATTTNNSNSNNVSSSENDPSTVNQITLFQWITAQVRLIEFSFSGRRVCFALQLGNMKINEIISMSEQVLSEVKTVLCRCRTTALDRCLYSVTNSCWQRWTRTSMTCPKGFLIISWNESTALRSDSLICNKCWRSWRTGKKNRKIVPKLVVDLIRSVFERTFASFQYLSSQRQRFSSSIGNQNDLMLIRDLSGIHIQNLFEVASRHKKLIDKEQIIRKSKQEIIDLLHYRFKLISDNWFVSLWFFSFLTDRNLMLLQRQLVDFDAQQSLYIHKLNRTRKMMTFLRQLDQAPSLYRKFLVESCRRKEHSLVFNQVRSSRRTKNLWIRFLCFVPSSNSVFGEDLSRSEADLPRRNVSQTEIYRRTRFAGKLCFVEMKRRSCFQSHISFSIFFLDWNSCRLSSS